MSAALKAAAASGAAKVCCTDMVLQGYPVCQCELTRSPGSNISTSLATFSSTSSHAQCFSASAGSCKCSHQGLRLFCGSGCSCRRIPHSSCSIRCACFDTHAAQTLQHSCYGVVCLDAEVSVKDIHEMSMPSQPLSLRLTYACCSTERSQVFPYAAALQGDQGTASAEVISASSVREHVI